MVYPQYHNFTHYKISPGEEATIEAIGVYKEIPAYMSPSNNEKYAIFFDSDGTYFPIPAGIKEIIIDFSLQSSDISSVESDEIRLQIK